jgi:acetylornithine deacetylase/succinyl-diaminopimelate desuccinylase-like protein
MHDLIAQVDSNRVRYLSELKDFLAIESISSQAIHDADMRRCAQWTVEHLQSIGMNKATIYETAGHPVVYAEWNGAPGKPTILFYGHYDVQPVDPVDDPAV